MTGVQTCALPIFDTLLYHDPKKSALEVKTISEQQLHAFVRNRETLALLAWEPYMHNPKLRRRLHRVSMPTLFVRGASDGLISAEYLAGYAALVPNSKTMTIAEAGHSPQLEQPQALATAVLNFLGT